MFKTILIAYDGSEHAQKALNTAVAMAKAFGADLHLVTTPEPDMPAIIMGAYGEAVPIPPSDEQVQEAGALVVNDATARLGDTGVTLKDSHILRGDSVGNILSIADATGADIIIMGRRGLGVFKALALGSVSQAVAQRSKIPCLTVV